jgi:uncharacterized delta-60 repeat protein
VRLTQEAGMAERRRNSGWRVRAALAVVAAVALLPLEAVLDRTAATAAEGDLVTSFGRDGLAPLVFPDGFTPSADDIAVLPTGEVLVPGTMGAGSAAQTSIVRLGADGVLDRTFAGGGHVSYDVAPGDAETVRGLALDGAGRMVVLVDPAGGPARLLRLAADGTTDRSFGTTGIGLVAATVDLGEERGALAVVPADAGTSRPERIVVGHDDGSSSVRITAISPTGAVDPTYGVNGTATVDTIGSLGATFSALAVGADGRVMAGGTIEPNLSWVALLTPAGALDTGFDGDGLRTHDGSGSGQPQTVRAIAAEGGRFAVAYDWISDTSVEVLDPSGGAAVATLSSQVLDPAAAKSHVTSVVGDAGSFTMLGSIDGGASAALARIDTNGAYDASFDIDGRQPLGGNCTTTFGLASVAGKPIAVADCDPDAGGVTAPNVAWRTALGTPDTAVSGDGFASLAVPGRQLRAARDVVVQPDGKILVVGTAVAYGQIDSDLLVARFDAAGALDPTYGSFGWTQLDAMNFDIASAAALDSAGRLVVVGDTEAGGGSNEWGALVARFTADGRPDPDFGAGGLGWTTVDLSDGSNVESHAHDLAFDAAGNIVVAGEASGAALIRAAVARLEPTRGDLDLTFGGNGVAAYNDGFEHWRAAGVTVLGDGTIVAGATAFWDTSSRLAVVRFSPAGAPSANVPFNTFGPVVEAVDLTPLPGGRVALGAVINGSDQAGVGIVSTSSWSVVGSATLPAFEPNSVLPGYRSMAVDAAGRIVFPGNEPDPAETVQAGRFALSDVGVPSVDTSFSGNGIANSGLGTCANGSAMTLAAAIAGDGHVLSAGGCDDGLIVAKFQADPVTDLSNLQITVTPPAIDAPVLDLPIGDIDRSTIMPNAATLAANPLRNSPLRNSPLRNSPLRNSPLRNSPLRNSPLRNSPLRNSSLPPILLSAIPLHHDAYPGGWQELLDTHPHLEGTPLDGAPAQTVTLQQLPDAVFEEPTVTLANIELESTPLRNSSLGSLLLGATPLADIPLRNSDTEAEPWCALYLEQVGGSCPNDLLAKTLLDLELAGVDLTAALWSRPFSLVHGKETGAVLHADAPLRAVALDDLSLVDTPLGDVLLEELTCVPRCGAEPAPDGPSLADAQEDENDGLAIPREATIGTIVDRLRGGDTLARQFDFDTGEERSPLDDLTLGQVIAGMIPAADFPYHAIPRAHLMSLMPAPDAVAYEVSVDLLCSSAGPLTVDVDLPGDYSLVAGSGQLAASGTTVEPAVRTRGDSIEFSHTVTPICPATPYATTTVSLTFDAIPSGAVGMADVAATVTIDPPATAPVSIDGHGATLSTTEADEDPLVESDPQGHAPVVLADHLRSGTIADPGDVDYYRVPMDAPPGSVVSVHLTHLDADFDALLFGPGSLDDASSAPLRNSPLRNSPLRNSPLRNSPLEDDGVEGAIDGAHLAPETLQDVPLRNSPLRNSPLRNSGLLRGTENEVLRTVVRERDAGQDLVVQVSGYDGAFAAAPYILRVEIDPPLADLECIEVPYAAYDQAKLAVPGALPVAPLDPGTETLILVNESRLELVHDLAARERVMPALDALAQHELVRGQVLSVDGHAGVRDAYAAWDDDPCSVDAANDVVGAINGVVDSFVRAPAGDVLLPNLKHIVLVGSDTLVPFARIPDLVTLANQADYRYDAAFNNLDNPISRAFARRNILSDDPYGDFDPAPWLDGQLYLPDVALGRLVETPEQITAAIDRFLGDSGGRLDPGTAVTFGYDFLSDGAHEVDEALRSLDREQGPASRIDETWSAADVVAALDGGSREGSAASVNAHYDHYRALPADGNAHDTEGETRTTAPELLFADDLLQSALAPGSLLFTMGCNAGVNLADVVAAIGGPLDARAADWAQTAAEKQAVFAANAGYGYGDTEVVAYSETLYAAYARNLAGGEMTAGQAFALAKHEYLSALGIPGVYDAKASQEAIFFGLPMFRIGGREAAPPFLPDFVADAATGATATTPIDVTPFPGLDATGAPHRVTTPRGSYWRAEGDVGPAAPQVSHGRPLVPRLEVEVASPDGLRAHGVLLEDLESRDFVGVDPVYAVPVRDLAVNEPEPHVDEVYFPSTFTNLTRTATAGGLREKVVLLPGQFFTSPGVAGGVQRLFTRMEGTVLHSDSADHEAPEIVDFDAMIVGATALFTVRSIASDVERVVVLYRDDLSNDWRRAELAAGADGVWLGSGAISPGATRVVDWLAQAADAAGNVGTSTNKGRFFEADPRPTLDPSVRIAPAAGPSGYHTEPVNVTLDEDGSTAWRSSVDGSAFKPFDPDLGVDVATDGLHRVTLVGSDGRLLEVALPVDLSAPTVDLQRPRPASSPDGPDAIVQRARVAPDFACADRGSVVVTCEVTAGTGADGYLLTEALGDDLTFTVRAVDAAGHETLASTTYRVVADDTPPLITVRSPLADAVVAKGAYLVADFDCADDAGVASCTATLDDVTYADGDVLPTLSSGIREFIVRSKDVNNNESQVTVTFTVGEAEPPPPPQVWITSPTPGQRIPRGASITPQYGCDVELCTPIAGYVSSTGTLDTATLGTKTFTVRGTSADGTTTDRSVDYVVVDVTAPVVTITSPAADGQYDQGSALAADFACADEAGGSGIASCTGTIADGASIDTSVPGTRYFTVTAVDTAGNRTERTVPYTVVDTTDPTIDIVSPVDGQVIELGTSFVPSYTCADAHSAVSCVGSVPSGTSVTPTATGPYVLTVTATDAAGNATTATRTVQVVDTTAPSVQLDRPLADGSSSFEQGEDVTPIYFCTDANLVVSCDIDGDLVGGLLDTSTAGTKSVTVIAADGAGNLTEVTATFEVRDVTGPAITIAAPVAGTYEVGALVVANYTCVDNAGGVGLATCEGTVAHGAAIDTSTLGTYTFTVTAVDHAGNEDSQTVTYTVIDMTAPVIDVHSPTPGQVVAHGSVISVSATCTDDVDGAVACLLSTDTLDTTSLGDKSITVTAYDNTGNVSTVTVPYTVTDQTAPTITLTTPADGATYAAGAVVNADFACTDQAGASGVASCVGTSAAGAAIDTTPGTHTFTVTAVDGAGNTSSLTHTYEVSDHSAGQVEGPFAPVEPEPILNLMKAGAAVPVKFRLYDPAGRLVTDPSTLSAQSRTSDCTSGATSDVVESTTAAGSSSFTFDTASQQFVYTWKTQKSWSNCRRLEIVSDRQVVLGAQFRFRK